MERIHSVNFKGLHYAKSAIYASEIRNGVKPYLLDSHPNKLLKDVIENSAIFNDLKDKTDVYISSYAAKSIESPTKYTRYVRAIFKDPYQKKSNRIDSINLQATGEDEITIFEKLKNISAALPTYKNFTNKQFIPRMQILFLGENGCDGFMKRGEKF